ncbi:MAG: hypothetical protein AAGG57_11595 [Pseudomonadota bacterium]
MGLKVLAIAVATGRAGYVYLQGSTLLHWGISVKAAKNNTNIVEFVQKLINEFKPDVVVTEKCGPTSKKGKKTRTLIRSAAELASHNAVLDVSVERIQVFTSKYEEAVALAQQWSDLKRHLPKHKRLLFEYEPRAMVLFEALFIAKRVLDRPSTELVAAMG